MSRSVATFAFGVLGLITALDTQAWAQDKPTPAPAARPAPEVKPVVPLRVTIVLAHYEGERRINSVPYTITVTTGTQGTANMGVQVPVANSQAVAGVTSFTYKNIGTNVSCMAQVLDDGRYFIRLTIEESSVLPDKSANVPAAAPGAPAFGDFVISSSVTLRNGEAAQFASGTNPLTGQATKIEVSVDVLK